MEEIYIAVRTFYFVWGFLLLLTLIYWGVQDLLLGSKCGHIQLPPEHYLFATATLASVFVLMMSLGEIFLLGVEGGFRSFLPAMFLLPASFAVVQGAFRVRMHRISVRMGLCNEREE